MKTKLLVAVICCLAFNWSMAQAPAMMDAPDHFEPIKKPHATINKSQVKKTPTDATSGKCGDNLTWSFDSSTGTLTISGNGVMYDFAYYVDNFANLGGYIYDSSVDGTPWKDYVKAITTISLPDDLLSIGNGAFEDCSSLTSLSIPNSVNSVGIGAFAYCNSLTSVTIPNSVTTIGVGAFAYCSSLPIVDNLRYADTYLVETADKSHSSFIIKEGTRWIGDYAFVNCSDMTSVTIPNSVTNIESGAFYGCSNLTSVIIPNSVTNIGGSAFYKCSSLTSLTIPNSVTSIGESVFYDCGSMTSVTIGSSVTNIGDCAFYGCRKITSVAWNAKNFKDFTYSSTPFFKRDGNYYEKFDIRQQITSFTLGNEVEYIPAYLCSGMSNLTSVTIPNNVTSIGASAFYDCSNLASIEIPNSVTSIGERVFYNCIGLASVTIGNSVTNIGAEAFNGCSELKEVHIFDIAAWCNISFDYFQSNPLYYAGHLFLNDEEIYNLTIPNSVTRIGDYAFVNCGNIETLSLGKSLEAIGIYSFNNFQRLIDIYCYAERVPTVNALAFNGVSRKACVWVPANNLRNYQTHEIWGEFDVKAMAAESVNASSVTIVPDYNTASVIWPAVDGADTYELAITDKDGKTICTLVFNGDGILQSIAFGAPSRNNAPEQTQSTGFRFEVSGFEEGTSYNYSIVAKDVTSKALQTFNGSFKTLGGVDALTDISTDKTSLRKELINGQLFILRGDRTYTVQGQEVK